MPVYSRGINPQKDYESFIKKLVEELSNPPEIVEDNFKTCSCDPERIVIYIDFEHLQIAVYWKEFTNLSDIECWHCIREALRQSSDYFKIRQFRIDHFSEPNKMLEAFGR